MATVEELIAELESSDDVLVVDSDLRTILIPPAVKNLGVEHDDDVVRLKFRIPRMYKDVDLSTFEVRVNYLNAKAEGDKYEPDDVSITEEAIFFSWLVKRHAVRYRGNVGFNVCLKEVDYNGEVSREFNTSPATLPVLEGLEVDSWITMKYADILEQWRAELFAIGSKPSDEQVERAVEVYLNNSGVQVPSDEHINSLINAALGVIENGAY